MLQAIYGIVFPRMMGLIAQYHPHLIRVSDYLYDASISSLNDRAGELKVSMTSEASGNADDGGYACAYDVAGHAIESMLLLKKMATLSDDELLSHVNLLISTILPQVCVCL